MQPYILQHTYLMISLQSVSNGWNNTLTKHEETLYENCLLSDFVEGSVLAYVAKERSISYKQLYIAFFKRWKLPEKGRDARVCIPWRKIYTPDPSLLHEGKVLVEKDSTSLVFIARVGCIEDSKSCALMSWNPELLAQEDYETLSHLIIDSAWSEATQRDLVVPECDSTLQGLEGLTTYCSEFCLTLHVLDVKKIQVMTLLEDNEHTNSLGTDTDALFLEFVDPRMPKLYGIPPPSSPFYQQYTERDLTSIDKYFNHESEDYDEFYNRKMYASVECLDISGGIDLDDGNDNKFILCQSDEALNFRFSSNAYQPRSTIYYPF